MKNKTTENRLPGPHQALKLIEDAIRDGRSLGQLPGKSPCCDSFVHVSGHCGKCLRGVWHK